MKQAITLLLLTLFAAGPLAAAHPVFSKYPREMKEALDAISNLPEAEPLLRAVQKEGGVTVSASVRFGGNFSAFWDGGSRHISVTHGENRSMGSVIQSVVFELHNAKRNREIAALDKKAERGKLTKSEYVEALERIEHRNSVEACALLEKGIQRGLFPEDTRWHMPKNFEEYFRVQQDKGHSGWIAQKYDRIHHTDLQG